MTLRNQLKILKNQVQSVQQENQELKDYFKNNCYSSKAPAIKTGHNSIFEKDIELWSCVTNNQKGLA